ncbi:uncharacterized protein ARMOST_09086 [Armillaria ostoyae]|uniref:Uncharacterized protein n=1 Tax=Armillaria ostoyae TaxID=47428 RepID=A0A284RAF6_ARMOS|nr:uncharacterized protein ARMOST_09086 [Armillaria ostoyae]
MNVSPITASPDLYAHILAWRQAVANAVDAGEILDPATPPEETFAPPFFPSYPGPSFFLPSPMETVDARNDRLLRQSQASAGRRQWTVSHAPVCSAYERSRRLAAVQTTPRRMRHTPPYYAIS